MAAVITDGAATAKQTIAYIGMGANIGDAVGQLIVARNALLNSDLVESARSSAFYTSSPVGYSGQPDFVNCVIELAVRSTYRALFNLMQSIEASMGRVRDVNNQNAARCIDIDLLLFGDIKINEADLIVPHPRMHQRLFVLRPLAELNANLALLYSNGALASKSSDTSNIFAEQTLHRLAL